MFLYIAYYFITIDTFLKISIEFGNFKPKAVLGNSMMLH